MKLKKIIIWLIVAIVILVGGKYSIKRYIYPYKYGEIVDKYSYEYNLDPFLVLAVIKTESNFNTDAESSKGAKGLMQIMDSTGEWVGSKLEVDNFNTNMLYEPEINIEFGCWYLNNLLKEFGDLSLALAAYNGGSGKINALMELLDNYIAGNKKILVFSQFTSALKNIEKNLEEVGINYIYLDGSIGSKERGELVKKFNEDPLISVFLISLKAGGVGLNLTSASVVIHFDPWWNPAVEDQATDRAHRIGQKHVVEVIKMISEGTIEEKIISLQEEKKNLIDKVVGKDIELGENISNLDDEDILALFKR